MEDMSMDELRKEIDAKQWNLKFRTIIQAAGITPFEFIHRKMEEKAATDTSNLGEMSQDELISELTRLGNMPQLYKSLSLKQQGLVDSVEDQWSNQEMTELARGFAVRTLNQMRTRAKRLGLNVSKIKAVP